MPFEFDPDFVIAPGVTLAEVMEEHHLTVRSAAAILDMDEPDLEAILAGAEPVTYAIASRLQSAFGISRDLWLSLERQYREGLAAGKKDITNEDRALPAPDPGVDRGSRRHGGEFYGGKPNPPADHDD